MMTSESKLDVERKSTYRDPHAELWLERGAALGRVVQAMVGTASTVTARCRRAASAVAGVGSRLRKRTIPPGTYTNRHA